MPQSYLHRREPIATDSKPGIVEKATAAETKAETADKFPDAALLKNHPGVAKAWIECNGTGTIAINDDWNVASISDNATGKIGVSLDVTMSSVNYPVITDGTRGNPENAYDQTHAESKTTTSFVISTGVYSTGAVNADFALVSAVVFGSLA